jgi:hypothetical protein
MLTNLLFQTPWWLPTAFIAVGLFVLWTGNQRQEKRVLRAGLGIALAGASLVLVSYLVDTPREKAERRTYQLVAAASRRDWPAFRKLLDQQTMVYDLRGPDEITNAAKLAAEQYNLGTLRITGKEVRDAGSIINVIIRVLGEIQGQSTLTDWQLQYRNLDQGWVLYDVKANSNETMREEDVRSRLPR